MTVVALTVTAFPDVAPHASTGVAQISGRVTDSASTPLEGICVAATSFSGAGAQTQTDADGRYTLLGLPPTASQATRYMVGFADCTSHVYATVWFDAKKSQSLATMVDVAEGQTTSGVDATLPRAGTITGAVTDQSSGAALAGRTVLAVPSESVSASQSGDGSATTDANGVYMIHGLPPGSYLVKFVDSGEPAYLPQWYPDQASASTATPVTVTAGGQVSEIDFAVTAGGRISGTVANESAQPLSGICVTAVGPPGVSPLSSLTGPTGQYTVAPLPTGSYKVDFSDCTNSVYARQWYDGQPTQDRATPVSVVAGTITALGTTTLSLPTAPDAPTQVTALAGDGSATVQFSPPATDGGRTITSYTAVASPGGHTATGMGPLTVNGLTNGQSYTFTVVATNEIGDSPPSEPSAPVVVAGAPSAPTITGVVVGDAQVTVAFTPPAYDGGLPVNGYTVESEPDGLEAEGISSPITVTGLTNGRSYRFVVWADNGVRTGELSVPSGTVAPTAPQTGGGSTGGGSTGGGGGGLAADLTVQGSVAPQTANQGNTLVWTFEVVNANLGPAVDVYLDLQLSSNLALVTTTTTRGPGCVAAGGGKLHCFLDWMSGDAPTATVTVTTTVMTAADATVTGTVGQLIPDPKPDNNTTALTATAPAPPATIAPAPVVIGPLIAHAVTIPARLVAGKRAVITFAVTRSDTGRRLTSGTMICDPSVAGRVIAHAKSFVNGSARLTFTIPKSAKGKLLKVRVTIKLGGQSATRTATFRVR